MTTIIELKKGPGSDDVVGQILRYISAISIEYQIPTEHLRGIIICSTTRNIMYVPDFVVNAGGMMGASTVIFSQPNRERAMEKIEGIYTTVLDILDRSSAERKPSTKIAEEMAALKIRAGE